MVCCCIEANGHEHNLGTAGYKDGWGESYRVRLSCDEIAFSGFMRVKFYPSRNYLYLQRVVRDTTQEFTLTHTTNDAMQFQESFALPPDLLVTVCLFLLQVSRNSSLVSRNFPRINMYSRSESHQNTTSFPPNQVQRAMLLKKLYWIINRRHIGRLVNFSMCYDFKQYTSLLLPRSCLKITRHEFIKDRKLSFLKAKFSIIECYNSHWQLIIII